MTKVVIVPNTGYVEVKKFSEIEELDGKLDNSEEKKLMHSVIENDKDLIEDGKLINDSINNGSGLFIPDMMFKNITKNFSQSKKLYGERMFRRLTGFSADYVKKNLQIPEFQREMKKNLDENIERLKDDGLIGKNNSLTDKAYTLASLVLYTKELDSLIPEGIRGSRFNKETANYGERKESTNYSRDVRFRDLDIKKTIKTTVKRTHNSISTCDLRFSKRSSKGEINIIYALDSSGSMNGKKIEIAKKAGIALSFKATEEKDKVGIIVFGTDIKEKVPLTKDFWTLLKAITKVRTGKETNIKKTIQQAREMFTTKDSTKHLILITDALPNIGKEPAKETLSEVSKATNEHITVSLIGINLDKDGEKLAKRIVEMGNGKLYVAKDSDNLNSIVLQDYYSL